MKHYKTLDLMVEAIKRGELPKHIVSPGYAAATLGISRQSLHALCKRDSLPCFYAERVILIDQDAVKAMAKKKKGVPDTQGELLNA